ncbi:VOC family protein [Salicibibacter cibi]|uniref:VOC family protein n=1 Tax=Salicibibacter cibi TaxID=2743001 RepID=A0A7T6Z8I5_9BACI|nr:VOC family protein [Salicibibacter cibi]QQK78672.1 VOC family protein [Salicibibacter cibi]
MTLQFDHVIHYVHDAYDIKHSLQSQGLHAVNGGRHEHRGTYNTLLHFDLSYVEYLGIDDDDVFKRSKAQEITHSPFSTIAKDHFVEGFSRVALRTRNLEALAEKLQRKGLSVNGPVPLSRKQPDGKMLEWSLLFAADPHSDLPLPFFIDWQKSDEERRTELKHKDIITTHEAGPLSIAYLAMAVNDVDETVKKWSKWFDLEADVPTSDDTLNAKVRKLHLPGGDLLFAEPTGTGMVSDALNKRGERPFLLAFEGAENTNDQELRGGLYRFK